MRIEQSFPLECCERCKNVRPYTNEQRLYSFDEVVEQVIVIGCEHEQECLTIYKMLKEQFGLRYASEQPSETREVK